MVNFTFVPVGPEWTQAYWKTTHSNIARDLTNMLYQWGDILLAEARATAPRDRGRLIRSLYRRVYFHLNQITVFVGSDLHYALLQELGTGIHGTGPNAVRRDITAKQGKVLRIPIARVRGKAGAKRLEAGFQPAAGKTTAGHAILYRFSVEGIKPTHFLSKVLKKHIPAILADVDAVLRKHGIRA